MKPSLLHTFAAAASALALVPSASASLATYDAAFDFGGITGAATFEFIIAGDPVASGQNGYIGQGSNTGSSLRYEERNTARKSLF